MKFHCFVRKFLVFIFARYVESTRKIVTTTRFIESHLRQVDGIHIVGSADVSVVAVGSDAFDIYKLSSYLTEKGWNMNSLQFPSSIHICVTLPICKPGVANKFVADVKKGSKGSIFYKQFNLFLCFS